ncbi:MAG TPA: hypothetical protein VD999_00855 [Vitreimonas sp.]|nr:hypothetical protein [Vitreimonas sp.]
MPLVEGLPLYLLVTGETGGTGATTLSKNLSSLVEEKRITAGTLYRAFAYLWHYEALNLATEDISQTWHRFLNTLTTLDSEYGLTGIWHYLETSDYRPIHQPQNAQILNAFTQTLERYSPTNLTIDNLTDRDMLRQATELAYNNLGFVLDAKLAIIAEYTEQLKPYYPALCLPAIKMLLYSSPAVADGRSSKRENSATVVENVLTRRDADWSRYKNYRHENGQPLHYSMLKEVPGVIRMNTDETTERTTAYLALARISSRLQNIQPSLSPEYQQAISRGLPVLREKLNELYFKAQSENPPTLHPVS